MTIAARETGITFSATCERDRALMTRLAAEARVFHQLFFSGRLTVLVEICDLPNDADGEVLGVCKFGETIELSRAMLDGRADVQKGGSGDADGILRLAADVLLHELCHVYQVEALGMTTFGAIDGSHGAEFLATCRNIMPYLRGVAPMATKQLTLNSCAQWPYAFKHEEFYKGSAPRLKRWVG